MSQVICITKEQWMADVANGNLLYEYVSGSWPNCTQCTPTTTTLAPTTTTLAPTTTTLAPTTTTLAPTTTTLAPTTTTAQPGRPLVNGLYCYRGEYGGLPYYYNGIYYIYFSFAGWSISPSLDGYALFRMNCPASICLPDGGVWGNGISVTSSTGCPLNAWDPVPPTGTVPGYYVSGDTGVWNGG